MNFYDERVIGLGAGAEFSPDKRYRYLLWRVWDHGLPLLGWVMLNPSTAGETKDDATIRRCTGFARQWGYGGYLVGNVYAYCAKNPRDLPFDDACGPLNHEYLRRLTNHVKTVVCAWGTYPSEGDAFETKSVLWYPAWAGFDGLENRQLYCLGRTKAGHPRHPLFVPYRQPLEPYA